MNRAPARNFRAVGNMADAVTTSDTADLPHAAEALYIGVTGDVTVDTKGGSIGALFKAHPVGYMPMAVTRVYYTGTTATNILALY
jgi:hypothetical protein